MTDGARRWLAGLVVAGLCAGVAGPSSASPAAARAPAAQPLQVAEAPPPAEAPAMVRFCPTPGPFQTAGCDWQLVSLPHRWDPAAGTPAWAVYRIDTRVPAAGVQALVLTGLSHSARLRVDGQDVAAAGLADGDRLQWRYLPLLMPFAVAQAGPVRLELAQRGHPGTVNGLDSARVADIGRAQALQRADWLREVLLPLVFAAAAAVAGVFGWLTGDPRTLNGRLLTLVGALALAAALKLGLNHVSVLPVPLAAWSALNLGLLVLADLLACAVVLTYLRPDIRAAGTASAVAALVGAVVFGVLPAAWRMDVAVVVFGVLTLAAAGLLCGLVLRVWRRPERLGGVILAAFAMALTAGLHDLARHLQWIPPDLGPLQRLATPALLVLLVLLLVRGATARRGLEAALWRETARRRALLQDLHDGVGSRLVALAFQARRGPAHPALSQGIDDLIRELQMIQQAVRTSPASLGSLLADARSGWGGAGSELPLSWVVDDGAAGVALSAEQCVATLRILQEAVANAMRHASPCRIEVCARPGTGTLLAELTITDDGPGGFVPGAHGGLRNMQSRARAAGLSLELVSQPGRKVVRLGFPERLPARRHWRWPWPARVTPGPAGGSASPQGPVPAKPRTPAR